MGDKKKSRRGRFFFFMILFSIIGVVGGHFAYTFKTTSDIEKKLQELGEQAKNATFTINYGNVPHIEYLVYGLIGGLVLGIIASFTLFKKKK